MINKLLTIFFITVIIFVCISAGFCKGGKVNLKAASVDANTRLVLAQALTHRGMRTPGIPSGGYGNAYSYGGGSYGGYGGGNSGFGFQDPRAFGIDRNAFANRFPPFIFNRQQRGEIRFFPGVPSYFYTRRLGSQTGFETSGFPNIGFNNSFPTD